MQNYKVVPLIDRLVNKLYHFVPLVQIYKKSRFYSPKSNPHAKFIVPSSNGFTFPLGTFCILEIEGSKIPPFLTQVWPL